MTTNFKSLCVELIEAVLADDSHIDCVEIARRARAALAEPEPVGPTDGELDGAFHEHCWTEEDLMDHDDFVRAARAVLARWGRP